MIIKNSKTGTRTSGPNLTKPVDIRTEQGTTGEGREIEGNAQR